MPISAQPIQKSRQWWQPNSTSILVSFITLVGLGLRLYAIGAKTVWLDEAFSIWLAQQPLLELWSWLVKIDQHPPLYYTLLHYWIGLFGDTQGPVRALSALGSGLAIPFLYGACRYLFTPRIALIAALLLAFSPFQLRYAQEARMYALLTLSAAIALYMLTRILFDARSRQAKWPWLGLALAQAAVMLTHNTATIFFPLALNSVIGSTLLWQRRQGTILSLPMLKTPGFARRWLGTQLLALVGWLPWSMPFFLQSRMVDREFWIAPPTLGVIYETLHNFNLAFQPAWSPLAFAGNLFFWLLAGLGVWSLRQTPVRALLLVTLCLLPLVGELLVSLRRPIFTDRTLIWTTLPYVMLVAAGIVTTGRMINRYQKPLTAGIIMLILGLNSIGIYNCYVHFEKEEWDKAATYVAQGSLPGDLILFNATWVQLPFAYYFRHTGQTAELRGLPVDLFDRGVLEPKMTADDLPRLQTLIAERTHVWLIYSHDWYTDPQGMIPRELLKTMTLTEQRTFIGLQVMHFQHTPE